MVYDSWLMDAVWFIVYSSGLWCRIRGWFGLSLGGWRWGWEWGLGVGSGGGGRGRGWGRDVGGLVEKFRPGELLEGAQFHPIPLRTRALLLLNPLHFAFGGWGIQGYHAYM